MSPSCLFIPSQHLVSHLSHVSAPNFLVLYTHSTRNITSHLLSFITTFISFSHCKERRPTPLITLNNFAMKSFIIALCALSLVAAVPSHGAHHARHPTPSKRQITPAAPVAATPSKRHEARGSSPSGWKRQVAPAAAVPSKRHEAHSPSPSGWKRTTTPIAPAGPQPSKRQYTPSNKRSIDEQDSLILTLPDDFDFSPYLCPESLSACPIAKSGSLVSKPRSMQEWNDVGFECVEFNTDFRSCGGCSGYDTK